MSDKSDFQGTTGSIAARNSSLRVLTLSRKLRVAETHPALHGFIG